MIMSGQTPFLHNVCINKWNLCVAQLVFQIWWTEEYWLNRLLINATKIQSVWCHSVAWHTVCSKLTIETSKDYTLYFPRGCYIVNKSGVASSSRRAKWAVSPRAKQWNQWFELDWMLTEAETTGMRSTAMEYFFHHWLCKTFQHSVHCTHCTFHTLKLLHIWGQKVINVFLFY